MMEPPFDSPAWWEMRGMPLPSYEIDRRRLRLGLPELPDAD